MTLLAAAQSVLAIASAAVPHVTRTFLAGGPELAKLCTQLAVYPGPSIVQGQAAAGANAPAIVSTCASIALPTVVVAYSRDCWPMPGEGQRPKLPDPADLTAWTEVYLADCWAITDGILEAKYDGRLGECDTIVISAAQHTGPTSGVCTMLLPVTIGP